MNPQLMAMLNGMYGGIPSDTDGIMPLGSGFAGQQLPQQDMQPQMPQQGGMPNMPLGSGMYGMGAEAQPQGNFALGSGLYGQTMPSQQDMQQGSQPAQPAQAGAVPTDGMDKFSQLMNNPMFQYGMGLVGAMHTTNPWGGGMTAFLQAQGQQAKIKQANAAAAAEQQRILLAQQKQAMEQRQYEEAAPQREATLGYTQANTGHIGAQTDYTQAQAGAIPSEIAAREATAGLAGAQTAAIPSEIGLRGAQAANLTQEAQLNSQKFNMLVRQFNMQMPMYDAINKALGVMGNGQAAPAQDAGNAPQPATPAAQAAPAMQNAPKGGGEWTRRTADFRAGQPNADAERATIIQQELANEQDPNNRAALERELTRMGVQPGMQQTSGDSGGTPVPGAPATPTQGTSTPASGGNDPLFWGKLGMGMGAVGMPGAEQAVQLGKMMEPQQRAAGGYTYNPATKEMTFNRSPYTEAELNIKGQENTRAAQKQQYEIGSPGTAGGAAPNANGTGGTPQGANSGGALPQAALDAINKDRYVTANTEIQKSFDLYKDLPTQITAVRRAQADVNAGVYAGTTSDWKKMASKAYTDAFGLAPDPKVVNSEDFTAAMSQAWMKAVKQVDPNVTERQMNGIKDSFGSLANDPAALKNILHETEASLLATAQRHNRSVQQYETKMGQDPYSRYIAVPTADEARPAASASIAAPATSNAPKVGMVKGGYVFMGGDPANQKSWAPAPKGK